MPGVGGKVGELARRRSSAVLYLFFSVRTGRAFVLSAAFDPARGGVRYRLLKAAVDAVFRFEARGDDVELQRADDADDPVAAVKRLENLRRAFLRQFFERFF